MAKSGRGLVEGKAVFSTHDAAKICQVTPMTVIRWVEEGKLPAFKTAGGHRRIQRRDLEAFCRARGIPFEIAGENSMRRVLVVSPDLDTRKAVAECLKSLEPSLSVELAGNAFDAGRQVSEFRPAMVFLDEQVPGMDSLETCEKLARGDLRIAVVVLARALTPDTERRFRNRGALTCVAARPPAREVQRLVREALRLPN